jgi:D-lyxose ketol-isomerase
MAKKKEAKFSVTKAVKRNARDRVGQPKPEKIIVSEPQQTRRERRHKKTLADLLEREE